MSVASLGLPCDSSLGKESTCNAGDPGSIPGSGRSAGEGVGCNTPVFSGFPRGSAGKESTCNAGDLGWEDPLEKGMAIYSQYSGLENSMDCIVHEVAQLDTTKRFSRTSGWLGGIDLFLFLFYISLLLQNTLLTNWYFSISDELLIVT